MINRNGTIRWDFYRFQFLKMGISIGLFACLLLLNWTTEKDTILYSSGDFFVDEIEVIPARTQFKEKKVKKEVKPKKKSVLKKIIQPIVMEIMEIQDLSKDNSPTKLLGLLSADTQGSVSDKLVKRLTKPKKEPIAKEKKVETVLVAEFMPCYGDCYLHDDEAMRRKCTNENVVKITYASIKYPAIARENGIEGTVIIEFKVDTLGQMYDAKILRDIGAGCGQVALDAIKKLKEWKPGRQNNNPVNVVYRIPVVFSLK